MKFIFLSFLCMSFTKSFADDMNQPNSKTIQQEGQLVSIRLVVGEPFRFFVVGREEAQMNLSDLTLTVRRLKPYPGKILSVDRYNDYFAVTEPVDLKKPTDLEVTTKIKGKSETLHFKIENQMH